VNSGYLRVQVICFKESSSYFSGLLECFCNECVIVMARKKKPISTWEKKKKGIGKQLLERHFTLRNQTGLSLRRQPRTGKLGNPEFKSWP
jgi:hypothetical protein